MKPPFSVHTTPHYERLVRRLVKGQPELRALLDKVGAVLESDPYNVSRQHPIKKLEGVAPGAGQYRLRLGRFRFRYDIYGQEVWLFYCGLRREDTYR